VYAVIEIIKTANQNATDLKRFIPLIAGALGMVCGLVAYFFIPGVMPTDNFIIAALIGGASGLASTGLYENIKNIFVKGGES
jgi:hypothetical protein